MKVAEKIYTFVIHKKTVPKPPTLIQNTVKNISIDLYAYSKKYVLK